MPVSTSANVLANLDRYYKISEGIIKKVYALGWGDEFLQLKHIGAVSQKTLDSCYKGMYPNADSAFYDLVFAVIGESHNIQQLLAVRENGLMLLDMLIIPQTDTDYVDIRQVAKQLEPFLTPRERRSFELRYCLRLSHQEIAQELAILPMSVNNNLRRLRDAIRITPVFREMIKLVFTPDYFTYLEAKKNGETLKPFDKHRLQQLFPDNNLRTKKSH